MKFADADPPYIGQAKRHYKKHPDYAGEVNHEELISTMMREYPDGWVLFLSCQSLQRVLALCPPDVRVLSWVKRYHGFLAGIRLQYAWEPVILRGGRQGPHTKGENALKDWLLANPEGHTFRPMALGHVIGKKPEVFCFWIFDVLGMLPGDEFHDLFPGTGAVMRAWDKFQSQPNLWHRLG